jgi:glycosyltransferase involved in cell wall biosynthesis
MNGAQELTAGNDRTLERPVIVGAWPGKSLKSNTFAGIFAESLAMAGCEVLDVIDPSEVRDRLDVLHIHWPEQVFWKGGGRIRKLLHSISVLRAIARMRKRGTKLVWMVHNLRPHDLKGPRKLMWPYIQDRILRGCDAFMTLSPSTIGVVRNSFPILALKPAAAALHPLYPRLADLPDQAGCRQMLSLPQEGRVFALLGLIRPYKGTESLIRAFSACADPMARLLIAGRAETPEYAEQISAMTAADPRITATLQFLSDRDFAVCLTAADVLVLPYTGYLHSGAFAHALSYARPVITPSGPFANDMAEAVGNDWVSRYEGSLTSEMLDTWSKPRTRPDLSALDPRALGEAAVRLYRQLLNAAA